MGDVMGIDEWPDHPESPGHRNQPQITESEPWLTDNPNQYYNENLLPVIHSNLPEDNRTDFDTKDGIVGVQNVTGMTYAEIINIVDGLNAEAEMWDARHEPTTANAERSLARRILAKAS